MESNAELIPRPYQSQLEEVAVRKNTIIHLPTGSGKTFIAIRLIKRMRATLQKPWGQGGKRCFFLVNTVPLVKQQKKIIQQLCPVDGVAGFSSEDKVDFWDKSKWDLEISKYQVIVMTSQILHDMITHKYINVEDISVIIFDECHHAVDDHPMRLIMKHFENCPIEKQPRVLGLTATLLNSNVKLNKVNETLRDLEKTFHASIATVDDMGQVIEHSTNPNELLQYYKKESILVPAAQEAIQLLTNLQQIVMNIKLPKIVQNPDVKLRPSQSDISTDPLKIVKAVKNMIETMIVTIQDMGIFGGTLGILAYIINFERRKRWAVTKEEELFYVIAISHSLEARFILLQAMDNEKGYNKIIRYSSEKLLLLLNILKEYSPTIYSSEDAILKVNHKRSALSGLILTKQRITSQILYNILKAVKETNPTEFGFLKHDYIVGFNVNPLSNTREQHYNSKLSLQALLKFKNGDLNCLISTSVLEEGVDVPQCLLVVRYDSPMEYRSYIQSKGRARSKESSFVILVDKKNQIKFTQNYMEFQRIEKYVHSLVHEESERDSPTEDSIRKSLYEGDDIPPYYTKSGARLPASSAISLLSRYCSILPHDQYTKIIPMWIQENVVAKDSLCKLVTIIMPISCPIKEPIQGIPHINSKSAKRSAALNVCKKLHEMGELDELTLVPRQYGKIDLDHSEVNICFPNWRTEITIDDVPKPGSKKRMRKHPKVYPKCLNGPIDWGHGNQKFYLHLLKLDVAFEKPNDSRERALYDLLLRDEGYGFLTLQPLPMLCSFPIFLSVGEVKTSLEMNYAIIAIDLSMFKLIKEFHFFIFNQVLDVAKKFIIFDDQVNNIFVVPVKKSDDFDIDWEVMHTYKETRLVAEPSMKERMALNVIPEKYINAVVSPWYRGIGYPDRYIVSNVLEYKTPLSTFESDSFMTYADYYLNKYNLEIYGKKDQPLLEVRDISTRMNCLLPRAATIKTFTDKQRKLISVAQGDDKPRGFAEVFIPEFCIKEDYPGLLWYKATLLPSVLHRINMFLIADELRTDIARYMKNEKIILQKGEEWLPIEVDIQVAMKSLLSNVEEPTSTMNSISIDRINNPIDESVERPLNIMSVKESVYQLQKKKISKQYPWDESKEPMDVERNLTTASVMDVECYDSFVTAPLFTIDVVEPIAPVKHVNTSAAILPPPHRYMEKIAILSKMPTPLGPELRDVLAALTTINSHDTFNLERAETLGDSFLKYTATLYLFHKFPKLDEGQLTNIKGRLIGNRNLYYAGERVNLGGRMKVEQFSPRRDFVVPGFCVPKELIYIIQQRQIRPTLLIGTQFPLEDALNGSLSAESKAMIQERFVDCDLTAEAEPEWRAQNAMQCYLRFQVVSDKCIADCVEALIGTYLMSGGIYSAISFLEWMKIIPPEENFKNYLHKKVSTVITEKEINEEEVDWLLNNCRKDIERIINYKFNDPSLLLEAFSHGSYIRNRHTRSYERLEFLGDAILDFLITSYIFENYKDMKPGDLTDLRSALVNNVTFAAYVVKLGLHKFLCSEMNAVLESAIKMFVEHQEEREHEIVEDVLYLIDEEDCRVSQYVDVPKCLSDIFESLTGAIYLDSGGDLEKVWSIIYRIMHKEINSFSMCIPKQPVRVLMEMYHHCPNFGDPLITSSAIPKVMVPVTFTKEGIQHTAYGVGSNKYQAKRAAAKLALKILTA